MDYSTGVAARLDACRAAVDDLAGRMDRLERADASPRYVVTFWRDGGSGRDIEDHREFGDRDSAFRLIRELQQVAKRKRKEGQVFAVEGYPKEIR